MQPAESVCHVTAACFNIIKTTETAGKLVDYGEGNELALSWKIMQAAFDPKLSQWIIWLGPANRATRVALDGQVTGNATTVFVKMAEQGGKWLVSLANASAVTLC